MVGVPPASVVPKFKNVKAWPTARLCAAVVMSQFRTTVPVAYPPPVVAIRGADENPWIDQGPLNPATG
jgi:hypothetical protein